MKINLAFLWKNNNQWIWWWDRKYWIYYSNLDNNYYNKYFIYVTENEKQVSFSWNEVVLTQNLILDFLNKKEIHYLYFAWANINNELYDEILKKYIWLINVNFTPCYKENPRILNLIISKTDYWKLKFMHWDLKNSYVVYNPIDFNKWTKLSWEIKDNYREKLINKKFIIWRIARAEPSKWHFLIIYTLLKLNFKKNFDYGFIFAWMPYLYRKTLKLLLSKKFYNSILFLPELVEYKELVKFYKSIDLFWQTSWIWESFGNVIAEAFCFKIPVITDFKWFYKKWKVNPKLYDAQIELVDYNINWSYCSTSDSIIKFIEKENIASLKILWENWYKKVMNIYNITYTSDTLTKILYLYWKSNLWFIKNGKFESITQTPTFEEVDNYKEEYKIRLKLCYKLNKKNILENYLLSILWRLIEYLYLIIRKLLLKSFWFNIEKYQSK